MNAKPEIFLLDTSAVMSYVEDEAGAGRVEEVIDNARVLLPWTVLMELYYITRQEKGEPEALRRYALLKQAPVEILWEMDEPTILTAARFKAMHRVSFADSVIAAFASQNGATLLHKDPEYEVLSGEVNLENLPYKTAKA